MPIIPWGIKKRLVGLIIQNRGVVFKGASGIHSRLDLMHIGSGSICLAGANDGLAHVMDIGSLDLQHKHITALGPVGFSLAYGHRAPLTQETLLMYKYIADPALRAVRMTNQDLY